MIGGRDKYIKMFNFFCKPKDWSKNLPTWKSQYSVLNRVNAMDCLSESLINIIYMLTGLDGSPRVLAKFSGTTVDGSSQKKVLEAANKHGIVPYNLWPTPDDFLWEEYYQEIPQEILWQAKKVKVEMVRPNLRKSPLWTLIQFPNGQFHGVAQISKTHYFDSEEGDEVKPLDYMGAKVYSQHSIKVKICN